MNYDIFIPVRLDSKRLPKKALKKINDKPIIQYLIERLQSINKINNVIICTTTNNSDNELIDFLISKNFSYFRGSDKDILERFLNAAAQFHTDFIIAVDGDDIYSDPQIIPKIIDVFEKTNADYITVEGVPVGFTPIGFKTDTLKKICELKITKNTETGYGRFFENEKLFQKQKIIVTPKTTFPPDLRMSLDYEKDFEIAQIIFKKLGNDFHVDDVLKILCENPDLLHELHNLQLKWNEHWDKNLSDTSIKDI
jgi:spore coat polysaccharide biosynthesis protein SpsF